MWIACSIRSYFVYLSFGPISHLGFIVGAIVFATLDIIFEKKGGGGMGILLGIGMDAIPESLSIGASVAAGPVVALALLMGIQNVPEGITSYREMKESKSRLNKNRMPLLQLELCRQYLFSWD